MKKYKEFLYDALNMIMFPVCKMIGHKWEIKDKSLFGFDCEKECKRCKSFISKVPSDKGKSVARKKGDKFVCPHCNEDQLELAFDVQYGEQIKTEQFIGLNGLEIKYGERQRCSVCYKDYGKELWDFFKGGN